MDFLVWPGNQAPEMSSRPKKARQSKSKVKVMLIIVTFFDIRGTVHSEFLPQGQTISQQVYKEILRRLLRSVREKRRELWQDKSWLLHHWQCTCSQRPSASRGSSWPRRTSLYWNNLPIHPILLRVTFQFSPSSRGSPREPVSVEVVEAISRAVTTELRGIPEESF